MSCTLDQTAATARAVARVSMTVHEMDRAVWFYRTVLDFRVVSEESVACGEGHVRTVQLMLGEETLQLVEHHPRIGCPVPPDSRSNDHWFQHLAIIVRDMEAAYARLRRHNVDHVSPRPQRLPDWNPSAGGIKAFYFRDPEGHVLEMLQFPLDKGPDKWRRAGADLMLGFDHTAIVVADTERSLRFYRDRLGMVVTGASENYGPEQERLNNVPGARLRITTLRTAAGPGIELLEYRSPRSGRPRPTDAHERDLIHWETLLAVAHVQESTLVRDPDGHALRLIPHSGKE